MAMLKLTYDSADKEIQKALGATIADATKYFAPLQYQGAYPNTGFGVGSLRPRMVGIANDFWQMTVTTSFADWINHTLGDLEYVLVTGVFNLTVDPSTTQLFPKANGQDLPIMSIEDLYALDVSRGWFNEPFVIRPNNNITIQAVGRAAQTERLGLMGYTVAKRSFLIDTTP